MEDSYSLKVNGSVLPCKTIHFMILTDDLDFAISQVCEMEVRLSTSQNTNLDK